MHFFGSLGTLSFISGFGIAGWIIFRKIWGIYHHQYVRDVVDQPLFFLSLVAVIVGVQLFLAGFLAEMYTLQNAKKVDYILIDKIGL